MPKGVIQFSRMAALAAVACVFAVGGDSSSAQQRTIQYYRLVKGFVAESKTPAGFGQGTGFVSENPWGQYTAYLMATNALGQRTFRIEHYLQNPDHHTAQGSTMYLLEGTSRALLIDTGNPAKASEGVNDLKTVVKYLLGHDDDGKARTRPLDFVVANTHNHGDHIGENWRMSDRTVYYMDLDWPAQAPPNYVPIREGGGATNHGDGKAVAQIDLGNRLLSAIAIPPHTKGSTGYLDVENGMLFTGDAIGSAWPWLQWAPISIYDESIHHLENVTRPFPDIAVFPAHFYQIAAWSRGRAPLNGRPLDRQYVTDMTKLTDGLLAGAIVGEPFMSLTDAYWAKYDTAQLVYSLPNLYSAGENGSPYHAVHIPGTFKQTSQGAPLEKSMETISNFKNDFYLIRDNSGESLFLLRGSTSALLIGTGNGEPGLASLLQSLIGTLPLDVAILDRDSRQTGGIEQLNPRHIYVAGSDVLDGVPATIISDGSTIDLGIGSTGERLVLKACSFKNDSVSNLALLNTADRVLYAGDAFEKRSATTSYHFGPAATPELDQAARIAWLKKLENQYDVVYLSTNTRWYTDPQTFSALVLSEPSAKPSTSPSK